VVHGAKTWLAPTRHGHPHRRRPRPDLGERYLDTIYQTNWVQDLYGDDVLNTNELATQAA